MSLTKRETLWSVSAGAASAVIPLLGIIMGTQIPLLAIFALLFPLPIYLTYLSQGTRVGSLATLIGALLTFMWGNGGVLFLYGFTALPAYFLCSKALLHRGTGADTEYYPESYLLQWLTFITIGLCLLGCTVLALIELKDITGFMAQVKQHLNTLAPGEKEGLETLIRFFPAMIALNWAGMQIVNAILAQKILERRGLNLRPSFSIATIFAQDYWMYALAACGGIVFLLDGVPELFALNLVFVFMLPHWFQGLGTIHTFFKPQNHPLNLFISGVYVLIFLIPLAHLIIVALGIFEPWIQLRARIAQSASK